MERDRGGEEQGICHASVEKEDWWFRDSGIIRRDAPSCGSVCSDMKRGLCCKSSEFSHRGNNKNWRRRASDGEDDQRSQNNMAFPDPPLFPAVFGEFISFESHTYPTNFADLQ